MIRDGAAGADPYGAAQQIKKSLDLEIPGGNDAGRE